MVGAVEGVDVDRREGAVAGGGEGECLIVAAHVGVGDDTRGEVENLEGRVAGCA